MKTQKNIFILLSLTLLFSLSLLTVQAKQGKYAVCHEKQMWLMNEAQAVSIGKCSSKTWVARLNLEQSTNISQNKLNQGEKELIKLIEQSASEKFKTLALKDTKLNQILSLNKPEQEIGLITDKLPQHIKEFLTPMMEFFLSHGIIDTKNGQYLEVRRFSIKLPSANPTIAEMIEEARKNHPDKKDVERYGDFYTIEYYKSGERLEHRKKYSNEFYKSQIRLDETKTVLDYNLKSGDVLLLSVDSKKYREWLDKNP